MTENSIEDKSEAAKTAQAAELLELMEKPDEEPQDAVPESPEAVAPSYADPDFAARYGVRRGMSKTRKILLAVVGLALLCGVAGYIAWNEANPQIQATVVSYTQNGNSITVTFEVDKSADQSVNCTIQAEDTQGNVIGSANVLVPSGRAKEDMVYTVNTTGTPNTAVVSSCTANS